MVPLEQWLPCVGYSLYEVSSFGRIRNIKTNKFLTPWKNKRGYILVYVTSQWSSRPISLALLIARAFSNELPKDRSMVIAHKDGDKTNCQVENLFWNSHSNVKKKMWELGTYANREHFAFAKGALNPNSLEMRKKRKQLSSI